MPPQGASKPGTGLPGSALGVLPTRLETCLSLHSASWEAHFSSAKLVLEVLSPGVSRCQRVPTRHCPPPPSQGLSFIPGSCWHGPGPHTLGSARRLNCPEEWKAARLWRGGPALSSGVDLLCDFWMSHLASLGFAVSPWESGEESKVASLCWCGEGYKCREPRSIR